VKKRIERIVKIKIKIERESLLEMLARNEHWSLKKKTKSEGRRKTT
jgi:hypothetical protein